MAGRPVIEGPIDRERLETMSSCPGESTLPSIGTDALGDSTYAAIEEHVEGCPECKSVLESLAHRCTDPQPVLPSPRRLPAIPGFEIHYELGRGAMGVVYLATRTGLDRPVALKVLPGAGGPDAIHGARRRWLREARAISSIRHPNVVPLYDYGEADGWFFLVLEYIPGGTLKKRLTQPTPPRVAAGLVETIARAVGYIHGRGVLHLDLKPSNILLDCEADAPWDRVIPRVADFGLAIFDNPDGSEASLAGPRGTPSYMAPEQMDAPHVRMGPTTDIYALGAMLYEVHDRPPAVPGGVDPRDAQPGPQPGTRPAATAQPGDPPRPRDHLPDLPARRIRPGVIPRPRPWPRTSAAGSTDARSRHARRHPSRRHGDGAAGARSSRPSRPAWR